MALKLACLLLAAVGVQSSDVQSEWKSFQTRFGRSYIADEEAVHFAIFEANLKFIDAENSKGHKYTLGVTQFADLPSEELFPKNFVAERTTGSFQNYLTPLSGMALASSIDWEAKGAVTQVVNENMKPDGYGACWAFAAVAAMESAEKIVNGNLVKLSEQQIVDCSGAGTCDKGGTFPPVWKWLQESGSAVCAETSYPYTCYTGSGGCRKSCTVGLPAYSVHGYTNVQRSEQDLMTALMNQPVAGAVAGAWKDPNCNPATSPFGCPDHPHFQFYTGGIYSNPDCTRLDHAVLVVGYGTSAAGEAYWKIKNSYGSSWGINGYALLQKGPAGHSGQADSCGVPGMLAFPNIRKGADRSEVALNQTSMSQAPEILVL